MPSSSSSSSVECLSYTFNKNTNSFNIPDGSVSSFCLSSQPGSISDVIYIGSNGTICSAEFMVDIYHTAISDLRIFIDTPWNSRIYLIDRPGKLTGTSNGYLQNLSNTAGNNTAQYFFSDSGTNSTIVGSNIWNWCASLGGGTGVTGSNFIIPSGTNNYWRATSGSCGIPGASLSSPNYFNINAEVSGMSMRGNWTLTIEDHATGNGGLLSGWSLILKAFNVSQPSSSSSSSSSKLSSSSSSGVSSSSSISSSSSSVVSPPGGTLGWFFDPISKEDELSVVEDVFGISSLKQPFGGSVCDSYGLDFSLENNAAVTGYADSINGNVYIDSRSAIGKYDDVEIDIYQEDFFDSGIVDHSVVEDTFEGVNSGAPASFSQVQHINIINQGEEILRNTGLSIPNHPSHKILTSANTEWIDTNKSSICFNEIIDSGEAENYLRPILSISSGGSAGSTLAGYIESSLFVKSIESPYDTSLFDISGYGQVLHSRIIGNISEFITNTHYIKIDVSNGSISSYPHEGVNGTIFGGRLAGDRIMVVTDKSIYIRLLTQTYMQLAYEFPSEIEKNNIKVSANGFAVFVTGNKIIATTDGSRFSFASIIGGSDSSWGNSEYIDDVCVFENKIVVVKSGHAWHDGGSVLVSGSSSVQMSKIKVPNQNVVPYIDESLGSVLSCCLFQNDQEIFSRLLLGGQKGMVSLSILPISFNQMNNDQIASAVQYSYPPIPSKIISSSRGKIFSVFLDSIYSNVLSDVISIRNGVNF